MLSKSIYQFIFVCYNGYRGKVMASPSNKKLLIFYVLKILQDYSDENHPLKQEEISQKIYSQFGMDVERKSVGANLNNLIELGYDIIKVPGKGFYLGEREFEPSEIMFLIDAVFTSKVISAKQAQDLCGKLYSFLSNNDSKKFRYIYKANEVSRTDHKQIFYTLGVISEAIESKKQISFTYNKHLLGNKKNDKIYKVSPYFFISSQGKYYLVSHNEKYKDIAHFKLEKIENVKILDDDIVPITTIKGYEKGVNKAKYANENIYVFGGESVNATLKLSSEYVVDYVYDWFDSNTNIYQKNGEIFAEVKANEQALIFWCLQYGDTVELITPTTTRDKIANVVKGMAEKYK